MVLAFGYALSIEHSAFSTLRFFNTPHFQHTPGLRTLGLRHSAFSCKPFMTVQSKVQVSAVYKNYKAKGCQAIFNGL